MDEVVSIYLNLIGPTEDELSIYHIIARCIIIYVLGIALVRIGKKRFLGKISAFDTILAIIIGSLLSRAITSTDYFLKLLAASLLIIMFHRILSLIAAHSDRFGNWVKGHERVVLEDGEVLWDAMKKSSLSKQDLMQALRLNARTADVSKVKIARLERNGDISVILKDNT